MSGYLLGATVVVGALVETDGAEHDGSTAVVEQGFSLGSLMSQLPDGQSVKLEKSTAPPTHLRYWLVLTIFKNEF